MTAFVGNSNLLTLVGLTSHVTGLAIADATVTVTVTDASGSAVTGGDWPLTMDHVANGEYRAVLADTLPLVARASYVAVITADGGTGRKGQWQFKFRPEIRR